MDELKIKIEIRLDNLLMETKHKITPPLNNDEREGVVLTILNAINEVNKIDKEYKSKIRKHLLSQRNGTDVRNKMIFLLTRRLAKDFGVEPQIK